MNSFQIFSNLPEKKVLRVLIVLIVLIEIEE